MSLQNLELLIPQDVNESALFRWAVVTDTSPLRIRIDGETVDLPYEPDKLIALSDLAVSNRVFVLLPSNGTPTFTGRRAVILGKYRS